LPVDLRVAGIKTIEEVNGCLLRHAVKYGEKFAVQPSDGIDAFLPSPAADVLKYILCIRENRKSTGDSSVSWHGKKLIAVNSNGTQRLFKKGASLEVLKLMDGSIAIQEGNGIYAAKEAEIASKQAKTAEKAKSVPTPMIPSADHPWRRFRINTEHVKKGTTQMT
jgi:hypothetical protein